MRRFFRFLSRTKKSRIAQSDKLCYDMLAMKKKIELYPADYVARRIRNNRIWSILTALLALGGLAACITLVVTTTTATEDINELATVLISAVVGCIVIFLWKNFVYAGGRELRHIRTVLSETPETIRGSYALLPGKFRIPGSADVQALRVTDADGNVRRLHVNVRRSRLFRNQSGEATIYVVHGFVVAFED